MALTQRPPIPGRFNWGTEINECFTQDLFVYGKHVKVGAGGGSETGHVGRISVLLAIHENLLKKTVNTTERLQFINRNIRFDKLVICVIRLFVYS